MNQINVNISQNKNSISADIKNVVPINPAKGTFKINKNGKFNVKEFEFADVNVDNVNTQKKSLTISKNGSYEILPDENYFLEKASVNVNVPIPDGYIKPSGILNVDKNNIYDVTNYEKVNVEVPMPKGNIDITDTKEYDVTKYATAKIKDENLKAENIAEGVEILEIIGTFKGGVDTNDATATADDILLGKTAYVNEQKITGNIETWDGSFEGNAEIYNPLNEYLLGTKTKITKEDLKGITEIRNYAFYYIPITEIEFPDTVVKIGDRAFFQTEIISVNLTGIRTIGQYAFSYTQITELLIPSSVTSLGQRCFENCNKLKRVVIECSKLQNYEFQNDSALEEIICLLETPPTITASTFSGTTCPIKVRADLVETYKSATNWTKFADRIVAYEGA